MSSGMWKACIFAPILAACLCNASTILQDVTKNVVWGDLVSEWNIGGGAFGPFYAEFVDLDFDGFNDILLSGAVSGCVANGRQSVWVYWGTSTLNFDEGELYIDAKNEKQTAAFSFSIAPTGPKGLTVLERDYFRSSYDVYEFRANRTLVRAVDGDGYEVSFPTTAYSLVAMLTRYDLNDDGCEEIYYYLNGPNVLSPSCNGTGNLHDRSLAVFGVDGSPVQIRERRQNLKDFAFVFGPVLRPGVVDLLVLVSMALEMWTNNLNGTFKESVSPPTGLPTQFAFVYAAPISGGSLYDLIIGDAEFDEACLGASTFYRNLGSANFTDQTAQWFASANFSRATFVNSSGTPELYVAGNICGVMRPNASSDVFEVDTDLGSCCLLETGAGSDLDLLLQIPRNARGTFYARDPSNQKWVPISTSKIASPVLPKQLVLSSVSLADVNGDDCADITATGFSYEDMGRLGAVMLGDCKGGFLGASGYDLVPTTAGALAWADFDLNGEPDLLQIGRVDLQPPSGDLLGRPYTSLRMQSGGALGQNSFDVRAPGALLDVDVISPPDFLIAAGLVVGDFDGDMSPDFAYKTISSLTFAINIGNGYFIVKIFPGEQVIPRQLQLVRRATDVIVMSGYGREIQMYRALRNSTIDFDYLEDSTSGEIYRLAYSADFDGNGVDEIIIVTLGGFTLLAQAQNGTFYTSSMVSMSAPPILEYASPVRYPMPSSSAEAILLSDIFQGTGINGPTTQVYYMNGSSPAWAPGTPDIKTSSSPTVGPFESPLLPITGQYYDGDVAVGFVDGDDIPDVVMVGVGEECGMRMFMSQLPTTGVGSTSTGGSYPSSSPSGSAASSDGGLDNVEVILGAVLGGGGALLLLGALLAFACCACVLLVCCMFFAAVLVLLAVIVVVVVATALGVSGLGLSGGGGMAAYAVKRRRASDWDPFMDDPASDMDEVVAMMRDTTEFRRIEYGEIQLGRKIGEGAYGQVFVGEWQGVKVAIKVLSGALTREAVDDFEHEALMMAKVSHHPHVVQFIGACIGEERLAMVLRFCEGGSLETALRDEKLDEADKHRILLEVAGALEFLHSQGVVHRDVAARNVLLNAAMSAKLADLGLARQLEDGSDEQSTKSNVGPVRWMAPEALSDRKYSGRSDAWSFGVLAWEVWSDGGAIPFGDLSSVADVAVAVVREHRHVEVPDSAPTYAAELFEVVFREDPETRADMTDILNILQQQAVL